MTDSGSSGMILSPLLSGEAHLKFVAGNVIRQPAPSLEVSKDTEVFQRIKGGGLVAMVEVPIHCGMRAGPGDYLLMGRLKFGKPVLKCIPKLDQFKTLLTQSSNNEHYCAIKI